MMICPSSHSTKSWLFTAKAEYQGLPRKVRGGLNTFLFTTTTKSWKVLEVKGDLSTSYLQTKKCWKVIESGGKCWKVLESAWCIKYTRPIYISKLKIMRFGEVNLADNLNYADLWFEGQDESSRKYYIPANCVSFELQVFIENVMECVILRH